MSDLTKQINSKASFWLVAFVAFVLLSVAVVLERAGARTRHEVCELRLSYAETAADSTAIYSESWRLPLPQGWKCRRQDAGD